MKGGDLAEVMAIFGPDAQALVDTSDPVTARRNQQVFSVAFSEYWRVDAAGLGRATLVVGFEEWPFPIPLVKDGGEWRFDTAAGKEEILARRIGRNELAVIRVCRAYVAAQRLYAKYGHDGKPAGIYAPLFAAIPHARTACTGRLATVERRSPLGDLLRGGFNRSRRRTSRADRRAAALPRLLLPHPHGAGRRGVPAVRGITSSMARLTGGFALVAWPAQYDVTGVMTFIVNQDGVVFERDLGPRNRRGRAGHLDLQPGFGLGGQSLTNGRASRLKARRS